MRFILNKVTAFGMSHRKELINNGNQKPLLILREGANKSTKTQAFIHMLRQEDLFAPSLGTNNILVDFYFTQM
ncbi:hypothetical protein [Marinomonas sp. 2405UD68-3]|uniref:hypothetical protein n=1 Tax=Marinomonas sp. 2405UD68-3 TaxID=3391835 RepID=UPI0039C9F61E